MTPKNAAAKNELQHFLCKIHDYEHHNWFVTNVLNGIDECGSYEITKDHIQELHNHCGQILSNMEKAPQLLPTRSGFYFGSIDYDYYYFREIQRTKSILEDILQNINFDTHYIVYNFLW